MIPIQTLIMEYLCPGFGIILGNFMYFAPYRDLKHAVEHGKIGDLNPTPWAFMMGNCCGWITYALLLKDFWIFWGTAPGFVLSMWLNMGAAKLQYDGHRAEVVRESLTDFLDRSIHSDHSTIDWSVALGNDDDEEVDEETQIIMDEENRASVIAKIVLDVTTQRVKAPAPHETVAIVIFTIWLMLLSIISYFNITQSTKETIIGFAININLIFFYGAPLSTIFTVLQTRNTASIHRQTMFLNTMNGGFWSVYGFVLLDPYIILPNGLGAVMGICQMFLCMVFPNIPADSTDKTDHDSVTTTNQGGGSRKGRSFGSTDGQRNTIDSMTIEFGQDMQSVVSYMDLLGSDIESESGDEKSGEETSTDASIELESLKDFTPSPKQKKDKLENKDIMIEFGKMDSLESISIDLDLIGSDLESDDSDNDSETIDA